MEQNTTYEIVRSILEGHRLGQYDLQQAVNLLQAYTLKQPEQTKQEIFQILWSTLSTEPLKDHSAYGHVIPSIHAVVIRSIATFGPTGELPARVFGLLR